MTRIPLVLVAVVVLLVVGSTALVAQPRDFQPQGRYFRTLDRGQKMELELSKNSFAIRSLRADVPADLSVPRGLASGWSDDSLSAGRWTLFARPDASAPPLPSVDVAKADVVVNELLQKHASSYWVSPVFRGEQGGRFVLVPDILVQVSPKLDKGGARRVLENAGAVVTSLESSPSGTLATVYFPGARSGFDTLANANTLARLRAILWAEPDLGLLDASPSSACVGLPYFGQPYNFDGDELHEGTWGVNIRDAWETCVGVDVNFEPLVRVAIIDEGIDLDHYDVSHQGNGKNFADNLVLDLAEHQHAAVAEGGCEHHGTLVASVVTALDNESGGVGVAYQIETVAARAHNWELIPNSVNCGDLDLQMSSWVASAVDWVDDQEKVRVLNHSWNIETLSLAVRTAYLNARLKGVVAFASVGNDNISGAGYPALHDVVNGVGALATDGARWIQGALGTQWGEGLRFVTLGQDIALADPEGLPGLDDGDHIVASGTSFSSPAVAAVAALLIAHSPELDPRSVEYLLCTTSRPVDPAWDESPPECGAIDAGAAMAAAEDYIFHDDFEEGVTGIAPLYPGDLSRWDANETGPEEDPFS